MIYLDKTKIPGYNQKVSGSLQLAGQDISGTGSSTARAETGDKAKELNIGTTIKFVDGNDLTALVALAEAKDTHEERKVYNIINHTAGAMGIRQVRFDGDVSISEEDSTEAWKVSFKLVEYHSIAEKKQQRSKKAKNKPKVVAQTKTATQPIVPIKSDPNDPNALAVFDKVLKGAEEKLR
ncbi:MAG: hypothetical protein ABL903_08525 [Methylococcales bacterium]